MQELVIIQPSVVGKIYEVLVERVCSVAKELTDDGRGVSDQGGDIWTKS